MKKPILDWGIRDGWKNLGFFLQNQKLQKQLTKACRHINREISNNEEKTSMKLILLYRTQSLIHLEC